MDNTRMGTTILVVTLTLSVPLYVAEWWERQYGWQLLTIGTIAGCLTGLLKKEGT